MSDLEYCIEHFHKPRMGQLAKFLLEKSEFSYEFFEPPTFETYMIEIQLPKGLIISINYFPIEITDETPFLFLQIHCLIKELETEPSSALLKTVAEVNSATELSSIYLDDGILFQKTVWVDDPQQDLDLARVGFLLRIFYNNLVSQLDSLT